MELTLVASLVVVTVGTTLWLSHRRVRCGCAARAGMTKVALAELESRLSPVEMTERRIGAKHFALYRCPACAYTRLECRTTEGVFGVCRRCSALAARHRHVTVREATPRAEGIVETRAACEHCYAIEVTFGVTPRVLPTSFRRGSLFVEESSAVGPADAAVHEADGAGAFESHVSTRDVAHPQGASYDPLVHEDAHASSRDAGSYDSDSDCSSSSSWSD